MYNQPCPLDLSELVFLGGSIARQGKFDGASYYCPRCDAAFLCWANPACAKPVVFTWRRRGTSLTLASADALKVPVYLRHGWLSARSAMMHGVGAFLQRRFSDMQGCPNDGCTLPLVAEFPCHERSPVRFYWCGYCNELFAYLRDEHYGWQYVVSFFPDRAGGYHEQKTVRNTPFADVIREWVASLPPPAAFPGSARTTFPKRPATE
jgi:hypothetical protein